MMKRILCFLLFIPIAGMVAAQTSNSPRSAAGWNSPRQIDKPYVILVSFDGFRQDYLDRFDAPNFARFARDGIRAEGLLSAFPSKTFPNHITIVTGLYPSRHGVVANSFLDRVRGDTYSMSDRVAVRNGTWYWGEPIWVTAERQGMVAATHFWPGSEAAIGGIRPSYWVPFDDNASNESRVDSVLEWMRFPAERRPHFLTLYFSTVDTAGHRYGPASPEVGTAIQEVDRQLGRLLDGIDKLAIRDKVYILLVSDHGMSESGPDKYISIESLIDPNRVKVGDAGPFANLYIEGGRSVARAVRDEINAKLQHGRAYLREEVPAYLHYNRGSRIGDVVVIMEEHYQIGSANRAPKTPGGAHGWPPDLKSMHGIFLARGPGLKKDARIPLVRNIDIYPFMAELLHLRPARTIDGRSGQIHSLCVEKSKARTRAPKRRAA